MTENRLYHAYRMISSTVLIMLLLPFALAGMPTYQAVAEDWTPPRTVYIPESGHTLDQVFLDAWRETGGASTFGYPVTPEITQDDGSIVQYLQYARFEYYPEGNEQGYTFALGDIGEELRPFNLQRSVSSFTSTGAPEQSSSIAANADFLKAWMPVDAPRTERAHVRYVEETGHTVRYAFLTFWEQSGGVDYLGNPVTEEYTIDGTTYQIFERGQLAWENGKEAWLMPVGEMLAEKYKIDTSPVDQGNIPTYSEELFIPPQPAVEIAGPGPVPGSAKSIVVSISQQRMWAYEGETMVNTSLVSTGKPGFDTPIGTYSIIVKKPIEDMEGLIGGEYYNVTDVPDVMYFTDVGHAFHGTYWHNNFGAVMSHGCVNLPLDVAAWLYEWTPMGTPVRIIG